MFTLLNTEPADPSRLVVLGAGGFIGRSLIGESVRAGIATLALRRRDFDLSAPDAAESLAAMLEPGDAVVMLAAITPDKGRDVATFMANLRMGATLCQAAERVELGHIVYLSSAAVYPTTDARITEDTPAQPGDLFGMMHFAREMMLQTSVRVPLAILRATQVHGPAATLPDHASQPYGPDLFRRVARENGRIVLAGHGDDQRDYIAIGDLTHLIMRVIRHGGRGLLNLATGRSVSVMDVARLVASHFNPPVPVETTARNLSPGHRFFDIAALQRTFPDFTFTDLQQTLARDHAKEAGD